MSRLAPPPPPPRRDLYSSDEPPCVVLSLSHQLPRPVGGARALCSPTAPCRAVGAVCVRRTSVRCAAARPKLSLDPLSPLSLALPFFHCPLALACARARWSAILFCPKQQSSVCDAGRRRRLGGCCPRVPKRVYTSSACVRSGPSFFVLSGNTLLRSVSPPRPLFRNVIQPANNTTRPRQVFPPSRTNPPLFPHSICANQPPSYAPLFEGTTRPSPPPHAMRCSRNARSLLAAACQINEHPPKVPSCVSLCGSVCVCVKHTHAACNWHSVITPFTGASPPDMQQHRVVGVVDLGFGGLARCCVLTPPPVAHVRSLGDVSRSRVAPARGTRLLVKATADAVTRTVEICSFLVSTRAADSGGPSERIGGLIGQNTRTGTQVTAKNRSSSHSSRATRPHPGWCYSQGHQLSKNTFKEEHCVFSSTSLTPDQQWLSAPAPRRLRSAPTAARLCGCV